MYSQTSSNTRKSDRQRAKEPASLSPRILHTPPTANASIGEPITAFSLPTGITQNRIYQFPHHAIPQAENVAVPLAETHHYRRPFNNSCPPSYLCVSSASLGHVTNDSHGSFNLDLAQSDAHLPSPSECDTMSPTSEYGLPSCLTSTVFDRKPETTIDEASPERPGKDAEKRSREKLSLGYNAVRSALLKGEQDTGTRANDLFRIADLVQELLKYKADSERCIKQLKEYNAYLESLIKRQQNQGDIVGLPFQYTLAEPSVNATAGPSHYGEGPNEEFQNLFPGGQ